MNKKTKKYLGIGCLSIVGLFIFTLIISAIFAPTDGAEKAHEESGRQAEQRLKKGNNKTQEKIPSEDSMVVKQQKPTEEPQNFNWQYAQQQDKMSGVTTYFAQTTAKELLHFDFPYNGSAESTLTIRKDKKTTIYYQISKGQIITDDVYGGYMRVKFDDEKPMQIKYYNSSDYSSKIIFLGSTNLLLNKLKKARKFLIEVRFFNAGSRQIEFDVQGLKWKHKISNWKFK